MVEVYMVTGVAFQVDCGSGASFVFAPSRFQDGNVEMLECCPSSARGEAKDALLSALVACAA